MSISQANDRLIRLLNEMAMQRGWSSKTLVSYRSDLLDAQNFVQESKKNLFTANKEDMLRYLAWLRRKGLRDATIRRRRSALAVWFSYLVSEEIRDDNPVRSIPAQGRKRPLPRFLSEVNVEALLAAPDVSTPVGLRDRCMLELLYATGMRVSELVGLTLSSLDMSAACLRVVGKDSLRLINVMAKFIK